MKQVFSFVFVCAFLVLSACGSGSNSKKSADGVKADEKPVRVEAGNYSATIECADAAQNAKLPKYEMSFDLKTDGSYTEQLKMEDSMCGPNCEIGVAGTYKATTTQFTFNQEKATSGTETKMAAETYTFEVVSYASNKISLQTEQEDNMCGGKLKMILTKK